MENGKKATANLMHGGSNLVSLARLAEYPTPEPTKTWQPVPHADVPAIISDVVQERGWAFTKEEDERFQLSVTPNGSKMFGVALVKLNGGVDEETGLAIGFRNSHDMSFALRIAIGGNVTVCDNLMITGDIQVRREHTINIDTRVVVNAAFDRVPEMSHQLAEYFQQLRGSSLGMNSGIAFLANAVEAKALPIVDFMEARRLWIGTYSENLSPEEAQIEHPGTIWAAYQSVTAQWKKHSLMQTQEYSARLNTLVRGRFSLS